MKVTAKDVASAAGVSPATASLVFRNKPGVGKKTREKVFACAQELGYEYISENKHTNTILLIIYKRHGQVVRDTPFFEELIKGVSDATYRYGYHRLSVSYFYANEDHAEQMQSLRSVKCAGIILLATEALAQDITPFEHLGVPIVLLDSWYPTKHLDSVIIDNARGAWEAVRHLISKGHKRIGYLHSGVAIRNFLERQEGFYSAMRSLDPERKGRLSVIRVASTIEGAYKDMNAYLETNPKLCSAYFADNDLVAVGCMRALEEHGVRLPDDVSIIGFDDTIYCKTITPNLTTMVVPKTAMGDLSVRRLDDRIKETTQGEIVRIAVLPTVIERDSVARFAPESSSPQTSTPTSTRARQEDDKDRI
jgi:LacI family transcriptional regulator